MRHLIDLEALGILFRHRVAPAAALIHIGLSGRVIDSRCRHGTPWQRLFPSILLLGKGEPSREQLLQAALMYAGESAMATAFDALVPARHEIRAYHRAPSTCSSRATPARSGTPPCTWNAPTASPNR